MNFGALAGRGLSEVEQRIAPAAVPFPASNPASAGGASSPLLWLAVGLVILFGVIVAAAALFGLPSAERFMSNATAQTAIVAIMVPLIGLLLSYRSFNKNVAAKVAIAAAAGPVGPTPPATVATQVNVGEGKP